MDYFGGRAVNGELAKNLQQEVVNAKLNEKWRSEFMQNMAFYMDAVSEGETKGRIEGRREGRLEGRREGRLEGRQEGRIEGLETGREEKGIQVFLRCLEKGMDREEAQSIAEISDEQVEKALAGMNPKR